MNKQPITEIRPFTSSFLQRLAAAITAALAAASAHAVVLPVAQDTASTAKGQLTTINGKSPLLNIAKNTAGTASSRAYLDFNVGGTGYSAADVTQARLKLYIPATTQPGDLRISRAATGWQETIAGAAPATTGTPTDIPAAEVVKKNFILVDVTSDVKAWLNAPAADFGFVIEAINPGTKVSIGAKEGSATGYPAELELDLAPGAGSIGAASLDPSFSATLPFLTQTNVFTGSNSFSFGTGARVVTIGDDSSGKAPVLNVGGTGINAGKLRLRNALHVFPSDDNSRSAEILLHDGAGVSTIGMFGSTGYIGASSIEVTALGVGGTNARADFTFFNGGPSKLLSIQGGADLTPEFVVNDGGSGTIRIRSNLELWPNAAGTVQGQFNVRAKNGGITISGDGETGQLDVGALLANSAQITTTLQAVNVSGSSVHGEFTTGNLNLIANSFLTVRKKEADIAAGETLNPTGSYMRLTAASGTAKTLSTSTAIANAGVVGITLILQGTSDTGTITVPDNANTQLGAASRVLGANDTLTLIWDGSNWIETAFSNN